jgi:hypothetical protein
MKYKYKYLELKQWKNNSKVPMYDEIKEKGEKKEMFFNDFNGGYLSFNNNKRKYSDTIQNINENDNRFTILLYNFLLKNYPDTIISNLNYKIDNFVLSNNDECGVNEVINNNAPVLSKSYIRTCDPIKSLIRSTNDDITSSFNYDVGPFNFKLDDITSYDLIEFNHKNGAKKQKREKLNITNTMKCLYDVDFIVKLLNSVSDIFKKNWIDDKLANNHTLIKYINGNINIKYVVIGDIHGSFATFIRHLFRFRIMGILDENCKTINDYHIIFLGDVIDRGIYDYETIMILYLLIKNNPDTIHYNRGNHEEQDIAIFMFGSNILTQFNYNMTIWDTWCDIVKYQQSALLIQNPINNKYIYLSHGGLPMTGSSNPALSSLSNTFLNNIPNNQNIFIPNSEIEHNRSNTIRWCDYTNLPHCVNSNRGSGYNIGTNLIKLAYDNNIEFIIRGHEDSYDNAWLLKNTNPKQYLFKNVKPYGININDLSDTKYKCSNFIHKININHNKSPNNVIVNDIYNPTLFNVLTISSNTDNLRPLTADSFIILKFLDDIDSKCETE